MATDTTALAGAIRAMKEAVAETNATGYHMADYMAAKNKECTAGRALLAALDGVPEKMAALESVAKIALPTLGAVESERYPVWNRNSTYADGTNTGAHLQELANALAAPAALDGGTDDH